MNHRTVKAMLSVLKSAREQGAWTAENAEDFSTLKRYINKNTADRRTRRKLALLEQ